MTAITRLGSGGFATRIYGSFEGRTAVPLIIPINRVIVIDAPDRVVTIQVTRRTIVPT